MTCSAPEMTTVSNPNKKPASAEVRDQKKMPPATRWVAAPALGELDCVAVVMGQVEQNNNLLPIRICHPLASIPVARKRKYERREFTESAEGQAR